LAFVRLARKMAFFMGFFDRWGINALPSVETNDYHRP
jgi:hypothetical protein